MARIPLRVTSLLSDLAAQLPNILGTNLVGIYLYGSLTQNAFNPKHSDVDCIVVTQRELSDAQFTKMDEWLAQASQSNPWVQRLQITFLLRDDVLTMDSPASLYQFGRLSRCGSDGNPIIWMNVLKSGVTLFGPPAESFVPVITPELLQQALVREVGYLREELCEKSESEWRDAPKYRAYAVLTLCRILYSFKHGTIVSKPRAARWAIKHLRGEWEEIIRRALDFEDARQSEAIGHSQIVQLINLVDVQLHAGSATLPTNR